MSPATAQALATEVDFELVASDGEPLETERHGLQQQLLASVLRAAMRQRGKSDFYVGANMFVYYSLEQAQGIAVHPQTRKHFKGPDVFFVDGVPGHQRDSWVVWEEGGRAPDIVVELASPSTEDYDRTGKKDFYAETLKTPEYFRFHPETGALAGSRLVGGEYKDIPGEAQDRLWSNKLALFLGLWEGTYEGRTGTWLRVYDRDGRLVPTLAEAERQRAEAAEAEVARLRALVEQRGISGE